MSIAATTTSSVPYNEAQQAKKVYKHFLNSFGLENYHHEVRDGTLVYTNLTGKVDGIGVLRFLKTHQDFIKPKHHETIDSIIDCALVGAEDTVRQDLEDFKIHKRTESDLPPLNHFVRLFSGDIQEGLKPFNILDADLNIIDTGGACLPQYYDVRRVISKLKEHPQLEAKHRRIIVPYTSLSIIIEEKNARQSNAGCSEALKQSLASNWPVITNYALIEAHPELIDENFSTVYYHKNCNLVCIIPVGTTLFQHGILEDHFTISEVPQTIEDNDSLAEHFDFFIPQHHRIVHITGHGYRNSQIAGLSEHKFKKLNDQLEQSGMCALFLNSCFVPTHDRQYLPTVPTILGTPFDFLAYGLVSNPYQAVDALAQIIFPYPRTFFPIIPSRKMIEKTLQETYLSFPNFSSVGGYLYNNKLKVIKANSLLIEPSFNHVVDKPSLLILIESSYESIEIQGLNLLGIISSQMNSAVLIEHLKAKDMTFDTLLSHILNPPFRDKNYFEMLYSAESKLRFYIGICETADFTHNNLMITRTPTQFLVGSSSGKVRNYIFENGRWIRQTQS